jgi:HD-like signal output (HDOD) protein
MPEAVRIVREEHIKTEPDFNLLTNAIVNDPLLAADVLRLINSPAFGLRRPATSIPGAIAMLGLANVTNLVSGIALRSVLREITHKSLDRFWDTASDVALISARVASEYTALSADLAYTLGLFHDCGIPLLLARHPGYGAQIKAAVNDGWKITDAELHHYRIDHATIGFHTARQWNLSHEIAQAILHHHNYPAVLSAGGLADDVRTLISVLKLSEHVSNSYRNLQFRRGEQDREWSAIQEHVLDHLAIGDLEFADLRDSLIDMVKER